MPPQRRPVDRIGGFDQPELVGPGGLLTGLTKSVLETALGEEMSAHLGYDKHDPVGRNGGNSRNGTRAETVLTEIGLVEVEVPRDRAGPDRGSPRTRSWISDPAAFDH
jgi:transposase-like protein